MYLWVQEMLPCSALSFYLPSDLFQLSLGILGSFSDVLGPRFHFLCDDTLILS